MPAPIHTIRLRNFKAFYGEEEKIELHGKHLLMYGENGSGKSSIYWALYTLFQSATKRQDEIQKYFTTDMDEHLVNHEYLKEHISFETNPANGKIIQPQTVGSNIAYVQLDLMDSESIKISQDGKTFGKLDGYERQIPDTGNPQIIEDFNRRSDFISHRLLVNFYNFRNSKRINLWEVFVRDVFPFLLNNQQTRTLGQLYQEIETNKPFHDFSGNTFKIRRNGGSFREDYDRKIELLNIEINRWIGEINRLVNTFYNKHFKDLKTGDISIQLDYSNPLRFGNIVQSTTQGNNIYYAYSKYHIDLNQPFIQLNIKNRDHNGNWVLIERPQSFFNEAKLTQLALSIRFCLLDESIRTPDEGKILALDDLLVSMDMSNRNKVLDIILNEFAPKYKICLFTHERAFFNLVKERLQHEHNTKQWKIMEIFPPFPNDKSPLIKISDSYLSKSIEQQRQGDYPAAVNYLRKELEFILNSNLPSKILTNDQGEKIERLDSILDTCIHFMERFNLNVDLPKRLRQYVKILLNPHSHYNSDTELYEIDLFEVRKMLIEFSNQLSDFKKKVAEYCPRKTILYMTFEFSSSHSYKYEIELQDDIWIMIEKGSEILSKCTIHSLRSLTIENGVATDWIKNERFKNESLLDFYKSICYRWYSPPQKNYIEFFETVNL